MMYFPTPSRRQGSVSQLLFLVTALGSPSLASTTSDRGGSQEPLWSFVDPLIGTVGSRPGSAIAGGNSFPGASLPWARMAVQWMPMLDTRLWETSQP
jgi:hypothetical protein